MNWVDAWLRNDVDPIPENVWLGATIVNQEEADRDIPKLLSTPAAVRFLSMEPLLGPVTLPSIVRGIDGGLYHIGVADRMHALGIDWVIAGGESGPGARPMHPAWARSLRDQCAAAGVPLHLKQWGEWANSEAAGLGLNACYEHSKVGGWVEPDGKWSKGEDAAPQSQFASHVFQVGKKAAGRLLDGVTHNAFPEVRP